VGVIQVNPRDSDQPLTLILSPCARGEAKKNARKCNRGFFCPIKQGGHPERSEGDLKVSEIAHVREYSSMFSVLRLSISFA
jgi:hypothetical protein